MGEGVSLSLVLREILLPTGSYLISVPLTREHVYLCEKNFSGGFNLPDAINDADDCGVLTKDGLPAQKGVFPSLTQVRVTDAGSFVPASFRSVVSSGNHVLSNININNVTIDASVVISGVVGITPNANAISGGRPFQHPGSHSPLNEKTEYGWLLPSGVRGMSIISTDLLKEEVEHTSITAAGSGAPDVTGKIISIGIVNSWYLDLVLKVSRIPDLSLDPQKCIKAMSSAEVSGEKLMVNSWNLDPVFKLSPATGLLDLISDGYPLSRGYGSGSLDPFGFGIRELGIIGTGHPTQAKGGVVPVFLGSISCEYRSGGECAMRDGVCGWSSYEIEAKSLFCYDQVVLSLWMA